MSGLAADATVVIVLHNSADHLGECLRAIPPDAEVVIVDNDSHDGWEQVVRAVRPDASVVRQPNNGFGAGCNAGAARARGSVLVFLNPDTVLTPGSLERLVERASGPPKCIAGPALLDANGERRLNCRKRSRWIFDAVELLPYAKQWLPTRLRRDLPYDDPVYRLGGLLPYVQGACMAVPRSAFDRVANFDERFFVYAEEEDLCTRLAGAGVPAYYDPSAAVTHLEGTSMAKAQLVAVRHRYRSMLLLYGKRGRLEASLAAAFILLGLFVRMVEHTVRRRMKRQEWASSAELQAIGHGVLEGYALAVGMPLRGSVKTSKSPAS